MLQFLTLFYTDYLQRIEIEVGPLGKLAEFFFLLKTTQIRVITIVVLDQSTVSKRVGEGVTTICVVLDQSTVIFQKGDITICVVWGSK